MKLATLTAALIVGLTAPNQLSAKPKTAKQPAPTPLRVAWNTGLTAPDGTPADSTQLWVSLPPKGKANGTTVVMVPGGGYAFVSMQNEGFDWLEWFNEKGYTVGVLDYRLPKGDPRIPMDDVRRAIGFFKSHAQEYGIDPDRVGVMGFSAGGHLAAITSVTPIPEPHLEALRPNTSNNQPVIKATPSFQVLVYPVISLTPQLTHSDTRNNFLGTGAQPEMVLEYSPELKATPSAPPAFIVTANDDPVVKPANSVTYYQALTKEGVPVELHVYPVGGHGFGFSDKFPAHDQMLDNLDRWLHWLYRAD